MNTETELNAMKVADLLVLAKKVPEPIMSVTSKTHKADLIKVILSESKSPIPMTTTSFTPKGRDSLWKNSKRTGRKY